MDIEGYNQPEDLYYEANHFWVKPEGDLLVMGLDDFGQKMAGDIVFIQLPPEGKKTESRKIVCQDGVGQVARKNLCPGGRRAY